MPNLNNAQLGKLIVDLNPYTTSMTAAEPVEIQVDTGTWQFKGVPYYIEKAVKIPYTYMKNGHEIEDYILVGYAGGGAY